jgi:hypothetical protein
MGSNNDVGIFQHFCNQSTNVYFDYKYKVDVISKQLIVDVFRVHAKGYVENPKGQVNKIVTL